MFLKSGLRPQDGSYTRIEGTDFYLPSKDSSDSFQKRAPILFKGHRLPRNLWDIFITNSRKWDYDKWPDYPYHDQIMCLGCGGYLSFVGSREGFPINPKPDRVYNECLHQVDKPVSFTFTSKTGVVALGNDFRKYFKDLEKTWYDQIDPRIPDSYIDLSSSEGKDRFVRHFGTGGYLCGLVGNTGICFNPNPQGGLDVVEVFDSDLEGGLWETAVARFYTELWMFAIVDAEDLPEGATDSYDRPLTMYDLPEGPGEYEFTYYMDKLYAKIEEREDRIWATLLPKRNET